MSDYNDWEVDDGEGPQGPPEEMLHLCLTDNGGWGLTIKDALKMREDMETGKPPPLGDSSWKHELEQQLCSQLHPDVHAIIHRIAWSAYRQGVLHGELLERERNYPNIK